MSKFVEEIIAKLQGDDAKVKAIKIEKNAKAAFKSQLAALESKLVDDQFAVEAALENYQSAVKPTELNDRNQYLRNISRAKADLDEAQSQLEATEESIEMWNKLQSEAFGE
jgi:hypothetical protein